jgi:3-dehydroquinate dehydratase
MLELIDYSIAENNEIIGISIGRYGRETRIHGPIHRGYLTFCCLDRDLATADGQMTVPEMLKAWRDARIIQE